MYRKANRKSPKLSPLSKLADDYSVSTHLKTLVLSGFHSTSVTLVLFF